MICPKCKKEIEDGSKFCEFCYSRIKSQASQASPKKFIRTVFSQKAFCFWLLLAGLLLLFASMLPAKNVVPAINPSIKMMMNIKQQQPAKEQSFLSSLQVSKDLSELIMVSIFCISLYFAFLKYKEGKLGNAFVFFLISIIFNVFFPLNFSNNFQNKIAIVAALFFAYVAIKEFKKMRQE